MHDVTVMQGLGQSPLAPLLPDPSKTTSMTCGHNIQLFEKQQAQTMKNRLRLEAVKQLREGTQMRKQRLTCKADHYLF